MSSGWLNCRVEVHERKTLVRHEDLDPEVVGVLDGRQADDRIFQREALAARAPRRVHLEGRRRPGRHRARHLLERGLHRPDVGGDDVLDQESAGTTPGEPGRDGLGAGGPPGTGSARCPAPSSGRRSARPPWSRWPGRGRAGSWPGRRNPAVACRCSPAAASRAPATSSRGRSWTQGPPGMTWWVWTSKMNSDPVSACWHAAVSSGGGTANVPPGPWRGAARSFDAGADEQPASSNTAREAATAPAPCKKRRRSTPVRLADSSMALRTNSLTALSRRPLSAGTNSPLEIGPAGSGSWSSCSSRSRRENRPLTAVVPWLGTIRPPLAPGEVRRVTTSVAGTQCCIPVKNRVLADPSYSRPSRRQSESGPRPYHNSPTRRGRTVVMPECQFPGRPSVAHERQEPNDAIDTPRASSPI